MSVGGVGGVGGVGFVVGAYLASFTMLTTSEGLQHLVPFLKVWNGWDGIERSNSRSHLTSKCVQWQAWLGPGNKTPTNRNIKMSFIQVKVWLLMGMFVHPELVNEKVGKNINNLHIWLSWMTVRHWIRINAGEAFKAQSNLKCFKVSNKLNLEIWENKNLSTSGMTQGYFYH